MSISNCKQCGKLMNWIKTISALLKVVREEVVPEDKGSKYCDAIEHDRSCFKDEGWDACRSEILSRLNEIEGER